MGVTIYSRKGNEIISHEEAVDMSYDSFYGLMEELGIKAETEDGTIGEFPIGRFQRCLESNATTNWSIQAIMLLKLCRIGIERDADKITWA